ncbi:MAG: glycine cleavage system protein GcvH [Candidatus Atribacteria bacterium]|nr:glycine cleavage system protein GcvH [Candidatus Atribacteria bacterium]MCD6350095.1 glycine cleavage system protein GcvH [Candidatus Atribacteria bacterium]
MNIPESLLYTKDHMWVKKEGDLVVCGITDYAQSELGDIVFIELPSLGQKLRKGQKMGSVESVKSVSNLYAPASGEIVEVNTSLEDKPEAINQKPYEGWIVKIKIENEEELGELLTAKQYKEFIQEN